MSEGFWSSVASGTVSGVVAGLMVSLTLAFLNYRSKPLFEVKVAQDNIVVLFYRGLRPAVIGGTWELGKGTILTTSDGFRAGTYGICLPPQSETAFSADYLGIGESFAMSIRFIPLWRYILRRLPEDHTEWEAFPPDLYQPNSNRTHKGWKIYNLTLKAN